ncbi:MAG: sulfotransferase [Clostridiales bacterium]|nr:sulfotransferase [Clostridiales bacterium]
MKILYIAGLAHTGSTLLSRILNQHSQIFAAGEMINLHEEYGSKQHSCSCLWEANAPEKYKCDFWTEIFDSLDQKGYRPETISRLSKDRRLEWIKACLNFYPPGGKELFRERNKYLYKKISEKVNSEIILDSSKSLWRLLPLSRILKEEELYILHLIKKPKNQLASRLKRNYNFWHSALLKYFRKNWLLNLFFRNHKNYLKIYFENLVYQPQHNLQQIYRLLNLSFEDPFEPPQKTAHHLRGHIEAYKSKKSIKKPSPARLKETKTDFNQPQQWMINFLNYFFEI